MDIVTELTGLLNVPLVILGCLVGLVIKHLISDEIICNKWIPVINVVLGAVLGVVLLVCGGGVVTAEGVLTAVIGGAVSMVASSGFYDAFQAFVSGKGDSASGEKVTLG